LRRVVLDRLIRYYRYLAELTARESVETITSAQLGAALDVDPSQVRKDFGTVGLVGMSHIGYDTCEACRAIRTTVGFDRPYGAILIGAGRLGGAILSSSEFERYGLRIIAVFDADPFKVGRRIEGLSILPMSELTPFVRAHGVRLAILTTPGESAQALADQLVEEGVRSIWNFTPSRLSVPLGVLARNERLSAGLAEIAYHLKTGGRRTAPTRKCPGSRASPRVPAAS
jgi:redox-sensing transcriptional repressor